MQCETLQTMLPNGSSLVVVKDGDHVVLTKHLDKKSSKLLAEELADREAGVTLDPAHPAQDHVRVAAAVLREAGQRVLNGYAGSRVSHGLREFAREVIADPLQPLVKTAGKYLSLCPCVRGVVFEEDNVRAFLSRMGVKDRDTVNHFIQAAYREAAKFNLNAPLPAA